MKALFGTAALLVVVAVVAVVGLRQTRSVAVILPGAASSGVPTGSAGAEGRAVERQVTQQIEAAIGVASGARSGAEAP